MIALSLIVHNTAGEEYLFLIGWGIWLIFCFGLCMLFRENRGGRGKKRVCVGLGLTALLLDAAWLAIFFPRGEYVNRGAAWGMLTLLCGGGILLTTVLVVTAVNHSKQGVEK